MSFVTNTQTLLSIACQALSLLLLWALVESNYLLTLAHVSLWASLAAFEHLSASLALMAFSCCVLYAILAISLLSSEECSGMNAVSCVLSFIVKFVVSVICGLVNLALYESKSPGSSFRKTLVFILCHVISISLQWAISETSAHIVVLALVHVFHWAWYPKATKATTIVCGAIVVQMLFGSDTFADGSLMATSLFCFAIDMWLLSEPSEA